MKRLHANTVSLVFLLWLCFFHALHSRNNEQQFGAITGVILDRAMQEPLAGANIMVNGTSLGAVSDDAGKFFIPNIPTGSYTIIASLIGYDSSVIEHVTIEQHKTVELTISLRESEIELDEVSVTADFLHTIPEQSVSVYSQSIQELRHLPGGVEDVIRSVSILPGVALAQAGRNDLIVRGGSPSENLFLIDHLEVPNINHFGTQGSSGGPLTYINLDFVEATSFSTGGFGVRYGNKLSSALSVTMRDGRKDRPGGKITVAATQFGASVEGPIDQSGSFIISARKSFLDVVFKAAGLSFYPEYWDYFARVSYQLNKSNRISFIGIGALDRTRLLNETAQQWEDNAKILKTDENQGFGGISWEHKFNAGYTTFAFGYRYNDYDFRQFYSNLEPSFHSSTIEREQSFSWNLVFKPFSSVEISSGAQIKMSSTGSMVWLDGSYLISWDHFFFRNGRTYWLRGAAMGAYAQGSTTLGIVTGIAGIRIDHSSFLREPSAVSPRFSLSIAALPQTTINASVGTYYQSPSTLWLTLEPRNDKLLYLGAQQYILGVDHYIQPDLRINVEHYRKYYFNYAASLDRPYLVMSNTGAGWAGSNENYASFGFDNMASVGSGASRGVELGIQKKISATPWHTTLSVSYNETEFRALDGVTRPGNFDQRWMLNIGGGFAIDEAWELGIKFRLATGRPYTPVGTDGHQIYSLYNTLRVETNHSLDVRADRRWHFSAWTLTAYLDIQNVYNRKQLDVPIYDEKTKRSDQPQTIGILPSIGVSAEF